MISKKRIDALVQQAEDEGIEGEIRPVLERALTVADLMEVLKRFPPETPVEVDIPVEIHGTDEMTSEVGYVIDIFQTPGQSKDADVVTLRACKPDLLEDYLAWEAEDSDLN